MNGLIIQNEMISGDNVSKIYVLQNNVWKEMIFQSQFVVKNPCTEFHFTAKYELLIFAA